MGWERAGQPDRVSLVEGRVPVLAPGEVLIEVDAAPVNNAGLLFTMGWFAAQPRLPRRWAPRESAASCGSATTWTGP
ncbi:hypothetical protein ACFYWP_34820 [Actinacidiphila glaucinigra]|uniref:hypothetical protein n=1 Tax=Actinacidiphila glaucinigra TaxID=235986 RepID=UPI00368A1E3A